MFQVFNADGSLQFDTSSTLGRIVSPFSTGIVNGSISIPSYVTQSVVTPVITSATLGRATPHIYRDGNNILWEFGTIPEIYRANCNVLMVVQ